MSGNLLVLAVSLVVGGRPRRGVEERTERRGWRACSRYRFDVAVRLVSEIRSTMVEELGGGGFGRCRVKVGRQLFGYLADGGGSEA